MESIKQGLQSGLWKNSAGKRLSYFSYGPPDAGLDAYHVRDELSPVDAAQLKEMRVRLCWNRRDAWFLLAAAVRFNPCNVYTNEFALLFTHL